MNFTIVVFLKHFFKFLAQIFFFSVIELKASESEWMGKKSQRKISIFVSISFK